MIKLGGQEVTKVMKGSQEIAAVYKGSQEVWSSKEDSYSTNALSGSASRRALTMKGWPNNLPTATFELWLKIPSGVPNQGLYSSVMGEFGSLGWSVCFNAGSPSSGNRSLQLMDIGASDTYQWASFTSSFPHDVWTHICLMVTGSSKYGFINGQRSFSMSIGTSYGGLLGKQLQIPGGITYRQTAFGAYFDARVSDILRYSTSGFTPPTAPFQPDVNTHSLTNRGTEFIDYSKDPSSLTLTVGSNLKHNSVDQDTPFI